MKKIKKNYDEQLIEQITNTLEMLLDKGFVYTYNDLLFYDERKSHERVGTCNGIIICLEPLMQVIIF